MSYELPFPPDKEIACELQKRNPLPFDDMFIYNDELHKYAFRLKDNEGRPYYVSDHVCGTTTLIKQYENEFDRYGFPNINTIKKIYRVYNEWLDMDTPHPLTDSKNWGVDYQDYIPLEIWELMYHHRKAEEAAAAAVQEAKDKGSPPPTPAFDKAEHFTQLFYSYFDNNALFRVIRPNPDMKFVSDMEKRLAERDYFPKEVIDKFELWESMGRNPYMYFQIMGLEHGMKCVCFPPSLCPTDIVRFWEGTTMLGTILHRRIELYYNGHHLPPSKTPDWVYFENFVKDHKMAVIRTEVNVGIPELRLCGQMDAIALAADGKSLIDIDWKRSKKLKDDFRKDLDFKSKPKQMLAPWDHLIDTARNRYTIQQNMYAYMFRYLMDRFFPNSTCPYATLPFSKLYLLVSHPINDRYILIDLEIFREGTKNGMAFSIMIRERKEFIEITIEREMLLVQLRFERNLMNKTLSFDEILDFIASESEETCDFHGLSLR